MSQEQQNKTRLAAIDCGTNTVLLLVADLERLPGGGRRLCAVEDRQLIPRLGQGLDRSGVLAPEAMERAIAALQDQAERARALSAEHLVAVGTESLRAAGNGEAFLARAAAAGVPIRVISGDEEARLSFRSVVESLPPPKGGAGAGRRSVLDIGGGSTELIVGGERPEAWRSVPIGSVRLTERLLHGDPPTDAERRALREEIDRALFTLPPPEGALCGLAGTVTTLGAMHLGLRTYDSARVDGMRLGVAALRELVERLGRSSVAERRQLAGLDPRRADVIYAGGQILLQVAERAGVAELTVSDRGVRWGVLEELADQIIETDQRTRDP
jgi:exopolyphosphatase/guanosine-5'-triphosphate,3'-diphosphate pyrophosphatase